MTTDDGPDVPATAELSDPVSMPLADHVPASRLRAALIGGIAVTVMAIVAVGVFLLVGRSSPTLPVTPETPSAVGTWRSTATNVAVASVSNSLTVAPDGAFSYAVTTQIVVLGHAAPASKNITCTGRMRIQNGAFVFIPTSGLCHPFTAVITGDTMTIRTTGPGIEAQTLTRSPNP